VRRLLLLLGAATLFAACHDAVNAPSSNGPRGATLAAAPAGGITLDQFSSTLDDGTPWGQGGTHVGKGFLPANPHLGDAIIATFFWRGTSNTITTVSDHFCDANSTVVGNTYTLVDWVTAGGYSMATYVATNVQGYPDPAPTSNDLLCVHAIFSDAITEGGVILSAYQGVAAGTSALGAYRSATGIDSTTVAAHPGPISVNAGALAYGVSMVDGQIGKDPPPQFTNVTDVSDSAIRADAEYEVAAAAGTVDPQWTWYFQSPHAWRATALSLNPANPVLHLVFSVQPKTTLPEMTIAPPVQVSVTDAAGNVATGYSGTVTVAIGHNGGMLMPGTLAGTKTVTTVNGVATFGNLSIDELGNGYTLVVTAGGITGAESAPFNIGAF
jgi:hypothetical protein